MDLVYHRIERQKLIQARSVSFTSSVDKIQLNVKLDVQNVSEYMRNKLAFKIKFLQKKCISNQFRLIKNKNSLYILQLIYFQRTAH